MEKILQICESMDGGAYVADTFEINKNAEVSLLGDSKSCQPSGSCCSSGSTSGGGNLKAQAHKK
jgi:hypothetical protein